MKAILFSFIYWLIISLVISTYSTPIDPYSRTVKTKEEQVNYVQHVDYILEIHPAPITVPLSQLLQVLGEMEDVGSLDTLKNLEAAQDLYWKWLGSDPGPKICTQIPLCDTYSTSL